MLSLENLLKLGRVKKTTMQMMQDRGYNVNEEFLKMTDLDLVMTYVKKAIDEEKSLGESMNECYSNICLIFLDFNYDEVKKKEKMICCEQAKNAMQKWKEFYRTKNCIVVSPGKMSPDAKKEFDDPRLTVMTHEYLSFPVGRHCMVPKHSVLSDEEKKRFIEVRKIQPFELPQIKKSDPISIYYGFKLYDIVKVERPAWTVFRVVTP